MISALLCRTAVYPVGARNYFGILPCGYVAVGRLSVIS